MARTRQEEAQLRAARAMQAGAYPDSGADAARASARALAQSLATGGSQPLRDELARDVDRDATRDMARDLAMGGTQPLRDELERDRMRALRAPAKGKSKGGY